MVVEVMLHHQLLLMRQMDLLLYFLHFLLQGVEVVEHQLLQLVKLVLQEDLEAVEQVRQSFAGKSAQVHVYPNSHHGFNCWARGSYDAGSAALAHGRSLQFLAEQLFS